MKKQRLLGVLFFFFSLLFPELSWAGDYKVLIVDENNNSIPFLCFKSSKTNEYVLSNVEGIITVRENQFDSSDSLQVESLFYENLKIQVADFLVREKIVLANRNHMMEEIVVYSSLDIQSIVEKMSRRFMEKYAPCYAAKMLHIRTVEANGKYREFCGYQGIFASFNFTQKPVKFFWEDKNKMYAVPLTVMRSDPFLSNKDESLIPYAVYHDPGISMRSKTFLKNGYLNVASHSPEEYKRSIEMYTPLNRKQLSNFSYRIANKYINDLNQRILVIRFDTKSQAYPHKTMIFGTGYIYYNQDLEYPERIVMENHQDQYIMFPRWNPGTLVNSATKHVLNISYCMKEEHIYAQSITLDVQWVDPNMEEEFYYIKQHSRRNPLKYNLHEYEAMFFSGFVFLTEEKKTKIRPFLSEIVRYSMPYVAEFDQSKWEETELPGVDRAKLFQELSLKNRSLYTQARENALDITYYENEPMDDKRKFFLLNSYRSTREKLYPLLYHEKYK